MSEFDYQNQQQESRQDQNQNYQNYQNGPYGYQQTGYGNQPYQGVPQQPVKPTTNLVWAILTTILCCLPFGIVSIVYAAKVDSLYYTGHFIEAKDASRKAGIWAIVSASCGVLFLILYIISIVVAASSGIAAELLDLS